MCRNHKNWCCQLKTCFTLLILFKKYHLKLFHSLAAQGLDFTFEALTAAALWYAKIRQFIWYAETCMVKPCIFVMLRYIYL